MEKNIFDILQRPVITEKATRCSAEANQYTFRVHPKANKVDIRRAVEHIYSVAVLGVRVLNVKKKKKSLGVRRSPGYRAGWKKAIVRIKEGQVIEHV